MFTSRLGTPYTPDGVTAIFRRACIGAKGRDLRFHDLRHTFATAARRGGAPLDVVARLLGHTSMQVTQRYAHIVADDLESAAGNMPVSLGSRLRLV